MKKRNLVFMAPRPKDPPPTETGDDKPTEETGDDK
jgi:hypothetical protein